MATLLSFTKARPQGWSNEEKAQFARIQKLLGDAGVFAEIDHGVTDEGDPWCAICSGNSGDVIIHVARIDGAYLFDSAALPATIKGRSLDDCAQRFIDDATMLSRRVRPGPTVLLHPSAMLAGVILTIFLYLEALGDNAAHARPLIDLDPETPEATGNADILDVAGIEEAPASSTVQAEAVPVPEADEADSPLLALKQMLQQIAEIAQKQENDRTGAQGTSHGQNWGAALLSSGAVVAAIAYAQDSISGLKVDGETLLSSVAIEASADGETLSVDDAGKEAATDADRTPDTTALGDGRDPAPAKEEVVQTRLEDFMLMTQAQTVAFDSRPEQTLLIQAPVEDRFFFENDAAVPAPQETKRGTGESVSAARTPTVEDVSIVSNLISFIANSSIELRDETVHLGDFIEIFAGSQADAAVDIAALPALPVPSPLPVPRDLVLTRDDALVFQPFEPPVEIASTSDIADRIVDFVRITGLLRYDLTDSNNLSIYDSSVLGHGASEDVVSRSFTFQDESVVTFIGLSHELDLLFAA